MLLYFASPNQDVVATGQKRTKTNVPKAASASEAAIYLPCQVSNHMFHVETQPHVSCRNAPRIKHKFNMKRGHPVFRN